MKAGVLYSGGKDSSLIAFTLKKLGFDVELCTANFGVYDSYLPAQNTAKILGFDHKILKMDFKINGWFESRSKTNELFLKSDIEILFISLITSWLLILFVSKVVYAV